MPGLISTIMKKNGACFRGAAISLTAVLSVMVAMMGSGCASGPGTEPQAIAPAASATPAQNLWSRTELYFSIGDWTETALTADAELRWTRFLDTEVTPRFPDGLTVADIYGQWRKSPGSPVLRERSKLVIIVHPSTGEASRKIDEIRTAWKQPTGEDSVMRITQPVEVSF